MGRTRQGERYFVSYGIRADDGTYLGLMTFVADTPDEIVIQMATTAIETRRRPNAESERV